MADNIKAVLGVIVIIVVIFVVAMAVNQRRADSPDIDSMTAAGFTIIENETNLVYRDDTKVVYIMFSEAQGYQGFGYCSPYISENGNYCRYVDGIIIEIVKE